MIFRIRDTRCLDIARRHIVKASKESSLYYKGRVNFVADGADVGTVDMLILVSYTCTFMCYKIKAICHIPGSLSTSMSTKRFLDIKPSSASEVLVSEDTFYCKGKEYKLVRGLCHAL